MIIYNVTIEPTAGSQNRFVIAWKNTKNNTAYSFEQVIDITPEETQWLWQMPRHRGIIGEKLFRFLDGEGHCFQKALDNAHRLAETLQMNLQTGKGSDDWPFEVLANNKKFLLFRDVHLVRCLPGREGEKAVSPKARPLKLLFMACSVMDVRPELDFEKEEEAIFRIAGELPVDMEVEDSGSLEGLSRKLEQEEYDVVHLSGLAGIDKKGEPYFIMEDDTGGEQRVFPDQLWNTALKKNPPRLVVLSGSRTGETPGLPGMPFNKAEGSFASLLVGNYNVPAVLGWGRKVNDEQAIHAGKMLFHELSRGLSIPYAVQRARYELAGAFPDSDKPAWPLLRLYSGGARLNAIVEKEQERKPKPRQMTHIYLKNSRVKVLEEGFIGRRRQLQKSLKALKTDTHKVGLLIMGTGGLGKSCLAGKICERFSDHNLIIIQGRLNTISMEKALTDSFIINQDDKGKGILAEKIEMTDKLTHLCFSSFKERNYLFLLDDFEQNLEGFEKGQPGTLLPEAASLLQVLLHYLSFSDKMSHVIITNRYEFSLQYREYDIVENRLEKIWLTGFNKTEQRKKLPELKHILSFEDREIARQLLAAGHGNPRLMEWLDLLVEQSKEREVEKLAAAIAKKQEDFIRKHVIRELLKKGGAHLGLFLRLFSIYRIPVFEEGVKIAAEAGGVKDWQKLLRKGMALSLAEHDQARESYRVTPLLREEFFKELRGHLLSCHEAAFAYFKKVCETRESIDPILTEEWIYHALGCGEEEVASGKGGRLVNHLHEHLALSESRRIGEWVLRGKKQQLATEDDGYLLNELGGAIDEKGDPGKAIGYYQQALCIWKKNYGEVHQNVAAVMSNLGSAWGELEAPDKAIDYYQQAYDIWKKVYGEEHQMVAAAMNNLGLAYNTLGEHHKAIHYFQQALDTWKKLNLENQSQVATALNNLGGALNELGRIRKAIDYYQQALEIDEQVYGIEHPQVAVRLNNLGGAYQKLGDTQKAIDYFERSLAINEAVFGREHPSVAMDLNNLGAAFYLLDQPRKAVDYCYDAFVIWEKVYGIKNHNLATTLSNLAGALKEYGFFHKAVDYYEKALDIDEKVFGREHPKVAIRLNNLGAAWYDTGDQKKAIDYFEQAFAISRKIYGDNHPQIATALSNMGGVYVELGDYEKAKEYLKKAYTFFNDSLGGNHPNTMTAKDWLDRCTQVEKRGTEVT